MRWIEPKDMARRTRRGFLFLPMKLGRETRWLEWTAWWEIHDGAWRPYAWVTPTREEA